MNLHFPTVTIIGVGLLGGSLGLALKQRRITERVIGVGRRKESLRIALDRGAIDEAYTNAPDALKASDLVVVCTPPLLVPGSLDLALQHAPRGAVVTDVASSKSIICAHASDTWPRPRRFVGSHPMAGSEKFGPEHAYATLFEDAVVFVERGADLDAGAREHVAEMWIAVGARVVDVDPAEHDRMVSLTSHVPHIAASALTQLLEGHGAEATPFIGNGFRDTTRIAEGRAEVWRDICLTNSAAIEEGLDAYIRQLEDFRERLRAESTEDVAEFFERGRKARLEVLGE